MSQTDSKNERRDKLEKHATSRIAPEKDDGNVEYKLFLSDEDEYRLEQFTSQMRYRMEEGSGECIYCLGVTDNGGVIGLTDEEFTKNKNILEKVAERNGYTVLLMTEKEVESIDNVPRKLYEFLVRETNSTNYVDVKVACAGQVDAGKSTLLSCLMSEQKDDGRGSARLQVFNFQHEMKTGRTSSVAQHILGFDAHGNTVKCVDAMGRKKPWAEIVQSSRKIVTFFDLCGHERYLKTTIFGLTSNMPDMVFIMVGANMGVTKMTKEHVSLCLTLGIPFVFIVTKIDICVNRQEVMKDTINSIKKLIKLPGIRRIPYDIKCDEDIFIAANSLSTHSSVPIFYVSNVTGEGINHVRTFLNVFIKKKTPIVNENKVELHIEQSWKVTGVGTVIGGQLIHGKISVGDKLLLGPDNNQYKTVQVRSIHCKRTAVDSVKAGRYVCLGVKGVNAEYVRRGLVLLSMADTPIQIREFEAEVSVLKSHSTTIQPGYEPVVHTGSIRQTAKIIEIWDKKCGRDQNNNQSTVPTLRTGDRAMIRFRFCYKPEFLRHDARLLLAEGRVKIVGKITSLTKEVVKVEKL